MKNYAEIVSSLLDKISKVYEFSVEEYKAVLEKEVEDTGKYSWDFSKSKLAEIFTETQNLITENKAEEALVSLYDYFEELSSDAGNITAEDIRSGAIKHKLDLIGVLGDIVKEYDYWKENLYQKDLNALNKHPFFEGDELKAEEIDPSLYLYVNKVVKKKLFKSYIYSGGDSELYVGDEFYIYPQVVVSESLQEWFHFLKKQSDYSDNIKDKVIVTLFLKLDNISPDFSNFLISFHKGDSIWLSSDAISFDNPHNKTAQAARNSGERRKQNHYDNIALPYDIVFNLDALRQESNSLVTSDYIESVDLSEKADKIKNKHWSKGDILAEKYAEMCFDEIEKRNVKVNSHVCSGGHGWGPKCITFKFEGRSVGFFDIDEKRLTIYRKPEILFKEFTKLHKLEKVYFIRLVETLIENIAINPPGKTVMLSSEFLNQKMLTGGDFDPQNHKFSHYGDTVEDRVSEILNGVQEKTTALAIASYSMVKTSHKYDSSWLATPEALDNIMKWTALDDRREELQKAINKLKDNEKADHIQLSEMLQDRYNKIVKMVFQAKESTVQIDKFSTFSADSKNNNVMFYHKLDRPKKSVEDHRRHSNFDIGKTEYDKEYCTVCDNYYSLSVKRVQIRHYKQLMIILGLKDRMDLPPFFRSYRAHDMAPYVGNSSLDNTHPYNRLKDPCSEDNSNGMQFDVFCCKKCAKEFEKKYNKGEHIVYDENGVILKVLEVKPKKSYPSYRI